ncbi:MAG: DUF3108 domain-containing protein [Acidobacteriota bacterium]
MAVTKHGRLVTWVALFVGCAVLPPTDQKALIVQAGHAQKALAAMIPGREQLTYSVSWLQFLQAGEVSLMSERKKDSNGAEYRQIVLKGNSVGWVSSFIFDLEDRYESAVSLDTLLPFRVENRWRKGATQERTSVLIDQAANQAKLPDGRVMRVPPRTYDVASLFQALRSIDFDGKIHSFSLIDDATLFTVSAQFQGMEDVAVLSKSFSAARIAIRAKEQEKPEQHTLQLYLSSDANRWPLIITAEPSWGRIRVELTSVRQLSQ